MKPEWRRLPLFTVIYMMMKVRKKTCLAPNGHILDMLMGIVCSLYKSVWEWSKFTWYYISASDSAKNKI